VILRVCNVGIIYCLAGTAVISKIDSSGSSGVLLIEKDFITRYERRYVYFVIKNLHNNNHMHAL
jgi:hypothetical protein